MPSPSSFSASSHDDVHDYDLDGLGGSSFDIINEIDKFLEGLDGPANLPADLEVVNKNNPKSDVEFVGKDSAVFQLLEDHENYGVYEHNPNECNWNVFYKTLPPGEQRFIKVEPKTEIVNDDSNTDSENLLETFSFNLDNTQEKPISDTSEISFDDNVLENFSFKISPSKDNSIKKNEFRKPNPWYRADSTQRNNVFHHKIKNQYQKNALRNQNPWYGKDVRNDVKSLFQSHLPSVRDHSVVGEYLCSVSLAGTTIKFESKKLANTSMREQIIIELATHGVIENNWWTPDDFFYTTYSKRNIAEHVFKILRKIQ